MQGIHEHMPYMQAQQIMATSTGRSAITSTSHAPAIIVDDGCRFIGRHALQQCHDAGADPLAPAADHHHHRRWTAAAAAAAAADAMMISANDHTDIVQQIDSSSPAAASFLCDHHHHHHHHQAAHEQLLGLNSSQLNHTCYSNHHPNHPNCHHHHRPQLSQHHHMIGTCRSEDHNMILGSTASRVVLHGDRDSSGELSSIVNPGIMMINMSPAAAFMPIINPNPESMLDVDMVDPIVGGSQSPLAQVVEPDHHLAASDSVDFRPDDAVVKDDMDLIEMVSPPDYSSRQNLRC
jgi:hypothetical protein